MKPLVLSDNIDILPDLISDCDGVCLDFTTAFITYIEQEHGIKPSTYNPMCYNYSDCFPSIQDIQPYIKLFLLSPDRIRNMQPFSGAIESLSAIKQAGKRITILTACGENPITTNARIDCFDNHFPNLVDDFAFVSLNGSKLNTLKKLNKSIVVDDLFDVYLDASNTGHDSILVTRNYNKKEIELKPNTRIKQLTELKYFK